MALGNKLSVGLSLRSTSEDSLNDIKEYTMHTSTKWLFGELIIGGVITLLNSEPSSRQQGNAGTGRAD